MNQKMTDYHETETGGQKGIDTWVGRTPSRLPHTILFCTPSSN